MQKKENSPRESREYVMDSYALLAYLGAEPGGERVVELLTAAKARKCLLFMCIINLGEVIYIVERESGIHAAQDTLARINELPIEIINADRALTLAAGHLKARCPISYADCFAAGLSRQKDALLVTGDPEFSKMNSESKPRIEWIAKQHD